MGVDLSRELGLPALRRVGPYGGGPSADAEAPPSCTGLLGPKVGGTDAFVVGRITGKPLESDVVVDVGALGLFIQLNPLGGNTVTHFIEGPFSPCVCS